MARKKFWTYTRGTPERYWNTMGSAWGACLASTATYHYYQLFNNDGSGRNLVVLSESDNFDGESTAIYMRYGAFGTLLTPANYQTNATSFGPFGGVFPASPSGQQPPGQMLFTSSASPIGDAPVALLTDIGANSGPFANSPLAIIPPGFGLIVSGDQKQGATRLGLYFVAMNY
jgi:hypothetical protein